MSKSAARRPAGSFSRAMYSRRKAAEAKGAEVSGGECGDSRQGREDLPQRQHLLYSFTGGQDVCRRTEANPVPEQLAHRPSG